jgi:hypothetical protein
MDPAERESLVVGLAALVRALHGGHVPHAGPFVA